MANIFPDCITEFQSIGPCKINVDYVVENWHEYASIFRYDNTDPKTQADTVRYRLFEDIPGNYSKTDISAEDACALMSKLGMVFMPASPIFKRVYKGVKA